MRRRNVRGTPIIAETIGLIQTVERQTDEMESHLLQLAKERRTQQQQIYSSRDDVVSELLSLYDAMASDADRYQKPDRAKLKANQKQEMELLLAKHKTALDMLDSTHQNIRNVRGQKYCERLMKVEVTCTEENKAILLQLWPAWQSCKVL
jgi:Mg2+ and Co2+ transporter CorA